MSPNNRESEAVSCLLVVSNRFKLLRDNNNVAQKFQIVFNCNDRIFSYRVLPCLRLKDTIFNVESLVQQSVNVTSSPSVTRKQLLLVLNCNSHLSCPFV